MLEFWSFFLILVAALSFSSLFRRFHLPWVLALICGGIVFGPFGLELLEITPTFQFLGEIGLVFLMFMAGLETPLSKVSSGIGSLSWLALINGAIPFFVGLGIAQFFGYDWTVSLLVGIVFVSSSVALVIPTLESNHLLHTRIGNAIITTTVLQDIASLLFLSILLQNISPQSSIPLLILYPILIALVILIRFTLTKVKSAIKLFREHNKDTFETELRIVFVILFGTVVFFELVGLHPIVAGFLSGLLLSEIISDVELRSKLHAISYGFFIPVFFVLLGAQTNIGILYVVEGALLLAVIIVCGSFFSKALSGWFGARFIGYNEAQSRLFAITSVPQLSTSLAVVFTGQSLGLFDQKLSSSLILLSVVTVFLAPILTDRIIKKKREQLTDFASYS